MSNHHWGGAKPSDKQAQCIFVIHMPTRILIVRECAQPRPTLPQEATKTISNSAAAEVNVLPIIIFNKQYLQVIFCHAISILYSPMSFFLDTGARMLLLSKPVWDKIKHTEEGLDHEPNVTHRLIGFDGVPIKVEGTASCCSG